MTSTRDKAVHIFQNLIQDPYYQGSKDKSREEVVWMEAEQRARQARNNELALSMAISKSPLSSVENFMNFMLLMKATELSFNPQEEADFFNNPDISDEIKDLYVTAKHPTTGGRPTPGHGGAIRTLLDMVRDNPDSPIPTKEVEDKPEEVKPTPAPAPRAPRETAEQRAARLQQRDVDYKTDPNAPVPQTAEETEQERAELQTAVDTAAQERERVAWREERELPQVPSHRTTEGRSISKGFHKINPTVFMPKEDATEMQKYTKHYAIPVEEIGYGQLPYGGAKTYVPMLVLNDLTTVGHTRFPFKSFINKFRNDYKKIGYNLDSYVKGQAILEHLWQKDEPANNAVFYHYLDELAARTVGDHTVEGSEIEGPLQDLHDKMRTYRESVNYWKAQRTPTQQTRNDARDDLVKALNEYNEAISSLENTMAENPHLDIPPDDRSGFRQQVLDPGHSAELSRLWFIEAYSAALGHGKFSDTPPFTPFSDFMERFRFSPEELTDKEREGTRDTDKNLQLNNAVHWGVNSADKVQGLLDSVLSSYLDKLPDNFLNHPDYGILDEDGNVKDIEAWQPHPTPGIVNAAGKHTPLSWYETLEKYLDGQRGVVATKKAIARNRPKIKTDVGRARARIKQILDTGTEVQNTPGMDDTTGIEEFGSTERRPLKQILNPETEDELRDTVSEHLLDDDKNPRGIENLEDYEEHIRKTMMEAIPFSLANPDSLIGSILGSVPMGKLGFTFGSAIRDFEPQNLTWLYPPPPTKGTAGVQKGRDRFRVMPDLWGTIFTRISNVLEDMADPDFLSEIPPEQQIATGVGKFDVTFDGKRYYADIPLPQDMTTLEEYMDEENGFLARIAKQLGEAKNWTIRKKQAKAEWAKNITYTEDEPDVEISDAPEEDLGEAQEGDEIESTSSIQDWLNNYTAGQTNMRAEDESLAEAILGGSERAEEVDDAVRDQVRENAPAFINALASDDDLKYLVGEGRTFSLNSETNTVSSRMGKFDAENADILNKINNLIDSHLMPKDEEGIPLIQYFGTAVEVPFSISRSGKPSKKSIRQAVRENFIKEYDDKYGEIPELTDDMSQEAADKIEEMNEVRQNTIEANVKWLDNIAPGTMSKYIDLIHGMGEHSQTYGAAAFHRDVLDPLREEATRTTPLGKYVLPNGELVDSLSELPGVGEGASDEERGAYRKIRTDRDEEVQGSRGVYFANRVLSNQDSLEFTNELANDIAAEFVYPWDEMIRLRAKSGKMFLAPEDYSDKQTFENFKKALSQMILPTGQSTVTKRKELDNVLHSFATNLVQSLTAADYREAESNAGEPDFDWGVYPDNHEQAGEILPTPPEIVEDILKELNNPMNGLLPFKAATPSISNLIQPTTRAGGISEWAADNAMEIEFFQHLLGPNIFNSWDGIRRAKSIFGKVSELAGRAKIAEAFAPNINGEIPANALGHLYSTLMLPATAEEWENPGTIKEAERWQERPGKRGVTNPWNHQLGKGFSEGLQQRIIQHFFANHHPDFMDAPFALSSIQSENDPIGQEYQRMREMIGNMAFGELGARQAFEMEPIEYREGTRDVPIENLRDLVTEEFAAIQLAMPFAASSEPIGMNSPSMLDDYVRKVLSLLKSKESEILETGESHPLYRLAVPAPTSDNRQGDLSRRIQSIEDAYIHDESPESLRNTFISNYWNAWLADPSKKSPNIEFPADPTRDEVSEQQQHIYDMWSDKPLSYELSTTANTFFSMAKLLTARGWKKQVEDHEREGHLLPEGEEERHLTRDQQDFLAESVMNFVNGFKQNADAINTTDPEETPATILDKDGNPVTSKQQQLLQAKELFKNASLTAGQEVDEEEYRPGTPNLVELGDISRRNALQTLPEGETAADPTDFSFARFNSLFPDKHDEEDESIPSEVIDWLKSDTDYTPLSEGGDGIRRSAPGEQPSIASKKPWLHPEADGIPGSPNYLKPHPDEGEKLSTAKRKLLQSKNWITRPHNPITGADGVREMHDVLLPYVQATENAAKQAAEVDRPYRTDTSSDPTVSGPASHKDLYDHLRTNSSRERGSFLSHDEYDNTIHPYLGRDVKQYFEDAGMLHTDEKGISSFNPNPPGPGQMSAKEYMDSLPRSQGRGMFHTEEGGGGTIPQQWVQPMVDGYKNGLRPMAPTPEGNGEDLLKSLDLLLKAGIPAGGTASGSAATGNNLMNRHHPGLDADWYNHDTIKEMFADVADADGKFVHDPALLQAWMDTHRPPLHHASQPGQPLVEMPYHPTVPRAGGPSKRMVMKGNFMRNIWRDIQKTPDKNEGGTVDAKKGMLGTLYNSINQFEKARSRTNIKGSPQSLRDLDYQTYINQQWIRILEDQLLNYHAQSSGEVVDLNDDDQRNDILGNMAIADRAFYANSLSREENLFKGHVQRWAVEHNVPEDSINHTAMRDFLSDSAQWGNNPIHWVEQHPTTGQDILRFNPHRMSSPPIQKLMHQHFIDNHQAYFSGTSPAKDFDAREQERQAIITPTATIDSPGQPAGTPIDPSVDEHGNPINPVVSPIGNTPSGPVDTSTGALDPNAPSGPNVPGPSIVTSESPRVTAAKAAQAAKATQAPAESRFKQGGLAWNKIAVHLGENSDMTPQEVIAYMHQMDEGELKSHWQAHVKERQERSKPTPEAPAGLDDAKRKDYISSIIAHSHEMHGLNIHDNNKFAEMNDKQLTDAYHKAHADVSAHRAKVSGESKQQYANDIVTRLAPLADDAPEDKILNQARSLMSEYLKHRSIFDKPALSHWQTLMNDMRGKAEQAGIDWESQMNTELNQHWENFGSPEHLEEVNRVKQEQQQKQQDYEAGLDKKFADAQQHPEYRPGRFINFSQSQQAMGGQQVPPTPRGHDYDRPFDFGVSRQDLDELEGEQPPVFEDARGRQAYGMYHPHSQSWINPFVYEQARTNMKQKNQNPHLTTTSVIRNGRQWTNTHQYEDNQEIDPKHSFAIPSQKKQAELEQNNMSQMGYMLGTDGNIVGLDSDWQGVLNNRDTEQDHPPHRIISDWHIKNLQQQHDQNPEYIGTRRAASMVTPKSQQAQQAQAQSQQQPQQPGTALERFANRREGLSTEAKKYSYNPQDFMSEWEKVQFGYNQFFDDKGGIGRGIGRALTLKNPFTHEPGLMDYWKDRTKEYESQNKVQELYQRMHQQYYGSAPPKPFYGSSEWAKKRAETEMAGHDTSGAGQSQYGPPPDQFQEQTQQQEQQTQPAYQEFEQPKEIKLPKPWLGDYSYQV